MFVRDEIGKLQNQSRKLLKNELNQQQQQCLEFVENTVKKFAESQGPLPKYLVSNLDAGSNTVLLTDTIKQLQEKQPDLAVMLISADLLKKRIFMVANVPKKLVDLGFHANLWTSETSKVCGGKGGGKPETAQGSGSEIEKLEDVLEKANHYAKQKLGSA